MGAMRHTFRVGTRTSPLAMRQTELIIDMLRRRWPGVDIEVRQVLTQGDRDRISSLTKIGGKGVFVKELEAELMDGTIDFAAHSLKDVQPLLPAGLTIGCVPRRDSPFDCLLLPAAAADAASEGCLDGAAAVDAAAAVAPEGAAVVDGLRRGARVGTNSLRRQAQLLHRRPDLEIVPIRGNVETRIRKIDEEHLDAIVLAEAGLNRLAPDTGTLRRTSLRGALLSAAGQGAMAVECRADDEETLALLAAIDDTPTRRAVTVERDFMRAIGGDCSRPIGAWARPAAASDADTGQDDATWMAFDGLVADPDGKRLFSAHAEGPVGAMLAASGGGASGVRDFAGAASLAGTVLRSLVDDGLSL